MQDTTLRLYAIIREDLEMTSGKATAQAGHAFLNTFLEAQKVNPELADLYHKDGIGTKVCLVGADEIDLQLAHLQAKDENLPTYLVVDSGHIMPPHFTGEPIVTALGIGPCTRDQIKDIVKGFKLL